MKKILIFLLTLFPLFAFSQENKDLIKGPPIPCVTPSLQASSFAATPSSSTSIDLTWLRGDGDNILILAHEAAAVDTDPVSGTSYTANAAFGSGTEIGTGNFVVYIGPASAVTVTNLLPETVYYFSAFEFLNTDFCYLIPGTTINATTSAAEPTITSVSPDNFFADKGKQLTITGTYLTGASVDIAGVAGSIVSNDGSTIVVDFDPNLYINNTLTLTTGVGTDPTATVTVNTRNIIPVGGGTDFHPTIQSALDGLFAWFGTAAFSTATAGYSAGEKTIDVYSGTYTDIVSPNTSLGTSAAENLIIQNHLGEIPIINAAGNANGFNISTLNYVQIKGFTVHGATSDNIYTEGDFNIITLNKSYGSTGGSGIVVFNAPNTIITNNLVYDNNQYGVWLSTSNNVSFKNNTLANNANEAKGPPLPSLYDPAQLFVQSGTGIVVENNIFYAKTGMNIFTMKTETGVTVSSDYNTYFKNGNGYIVSYNGTVYSDLASWAGNGAGASDLETDPDFVNPTSDFHIKSTYGSYPYPTQWPPEASASAWVLDATNSPALDAGNPADLFTYEPVSGGRINQGAYGNTAQASKSAGLYWDGSTSIDWLDITNWTPEVIPTSTDDIVIPDGCPNYPVIDDGATTAVCNNITITTNANIVIAPNGQMTVSGLITNNALAAGIIIKSDVTGDGSLIANNNVAATVERFVVGNQWHLMYPSLSLIPSTIYTVEGASTNSNFYSYNEANGDYWNATLIYGTSGWTSEVASANIRTDKGFLFNRYDSPNKVYIQTGGETFVSDKIFDVMYTTSTMPIENGVTETRDYFDGWNLAGNPFTSAVDWDLVVNTNIENGIYYFDGTNYRYYLKGGDGTEDPVYTVGITVNGGSRYIPAGQGFMVKAIDNGTFTIPQTAKTHNDRAFYKSTSEIPNFIRMQISKEGYADEMVLRTLPANVTDEHDAKFDAHKMFAWDTSKPQIYSMTSDYSSNFAINSFPEISGTKIIPVGVYIGAEAEYLITCTEYSFENISIFLHDKITDTYTKLNNSASYTFTSVQGNIKDRFELIFKQANTSDLLNINDIVNIYPNPTKGIINIETGDKSLYTAEITSVTGKVLYKNNFNGNNPNEIILRNIAKGIYFIKLTFSDNSVITKKLVIE